MCFWCETNRPQNRQKKVTQRKRFLHWKMLTMTTLTVAANGYKETRNGTKTESCQLIPSRASCPLKTAAVYLLLSTVPSAVITLLDNQPKTLRYKRMLEDARAKWTPSFKEDKITTRYIDSYLYDSSIFRRCELASRLAFMYFIRRMKSTIFLQWKPVLDYLT